MSDKEKTLKQALRRAENSTTEIRNQVGLLLSGFKPNSHIRMLLGDYPLLEAIAQTKAPAGNMHVVVMALQRERQRPDLVGEVCERVIQLLQELAGA